MYNEKNTLSKYSGKQRGVAFITAMLIMVIATIIGISISERMQISIRRTANILYHDLAYQYNLGGESWAALILLRDLNDDSKHGYLDSYREGWSSQLPITSFNEGTITGQIFDLQARFNLNNLLLDRNTISKDPLNNPSIQYFKRLLVSLELDPELVYAVVDWLDTDDKITYPGGAEDDEYTNKQPPYLAANQLMVDPSELRMVNGFTAEIMTKLLPHITVLNRYTELNVNTAAKELLLALDPVINNDIVDDILSHRKNNSFGSKIAFIDFVEKLISKETQTNANIAHLLDVSSDYFMVNSMVNIGQAKSGLQSTIYRSRLGKLSVIKRRRGVL